MRPRLENGFLNIGANRRSATWTLLAMAEHTETSGDFLVLFARTRRASALASGTPKFGRCRFAVVSLTFLTCLPLRNYDMLAPFTFPDISSGDADT